MHGARLMEQFKVEHFTGIIRSRAAKFYDSDTRRFVWDAPIILQLLLFKTIRKNQQRHYKKGLLKKKQFDGRLLKYFLT